MPPRWLTFEIAPGYIFLALTIGTYWITRTTFTKLRWAIRQEPPSLIDQRNVFVMPRNIALLVFGLWLIGGVLLTSLYGSIHRDFIPNIALTIGLCAVLVSTACYLVTEFALRPIAAQALAAGPPPERNAPGIVGRTMLVWMLGSGIPLLGIAITAFFP